MVEPRTIVVALLPALLVLSSCGDGGARSKPAPEDPPALEQLIADARHEMREGRLAEAGLLYDEALGADPDSAKIWTDVARLRFRGGEHIPALEAAEHALMLDPAYAPALLLRSQLVRDAHGFEAAASWFEAGLSQHPEDGDLLAEYAATLGDLGENRAMLDAVRRLAKVAPDDPRLHYYQAVLAARAGDHVLAASLLKRSGMREAEIPAAVLLGALTEMEQGNFDNAANALEMLHQKQPGNRRVLELFARALYLSGRDGELVGRFGALARSPEASPYLTMLAGRSLERLGQRREAAELIEKARRGGNGTSGSLATLRPRPGLPRPTQEVRDLLFLGRAAQARSIAAEQLKRFTGSADIMVLAGDAALASGDARGALDHYSSASQVRRPWPLTRKMVHSFAITGDEDAAHSLLVRHLAAEPRNTEAVVMLARQSARDEDWLRVVILLDYAIELGAGNDPNLLELRLDAARAMKDTAASGKLAAWLADLRPGSFLAR